MLWGAYHFGTGSDGVQQAEHFLQTIQPTTDTLVGLDFEYHPAGLSMRRYTDSAADGEPNVAQLTCSVCRRGAGELLFRF
ncbi:MAG: hypothetical protein JOY85_19670, partial [Acidobacteriaceae bacterium]|nr:hypothetical protein [Acidobacteriaceae bacterium]